MKEQCDMSIFIFFFYLNQELNHYPGSFAARGTSDTTEVFELPSKH